MSKHDLLFGALLFMQLARFAYAEEQEFDSILLVMDQAFDAVGSGDPDDMRTIQLAEGTSLSFRPRQGGKPGEMEMRMATNEALAASGGDDDHKYMERWIDDPKVMVHGPIAVVWGEYEF